MENSETDEEDGAIQSFERTEINLVNLENKRDGYNASKDSVNNEDIGLFRYTPKCFQNTFLNVYGLLFFLCWASTIQGATVNGLINLGLSTLERRFNLKSVQTGFIAGSYDIGFMAATLPISYLGGIKGASKPRYIASGLIILGMGSFLFAVPHFLSSNVPSISSGELDVMSEYVDGNLCREKQVLGNATEQELPTSLAYWNWFILGQILHGVGAAPILTLGITLLEESTDPSTAPFYIGIFQTFFVIGPALGYVIGGQFLELYVDFYRIDKLPENMTSKDPNWVGAWWLGFIFASALSWICGIFMFLYPNSLPNYDTEIPVVTKQKSSITNMLKEPCRKINQLFKNPSYVLLVLGGATDSVMVIGLGTFLPKFIMSQYGFTASVSAVIMGIIITPSGGLGTLMGGYLVKRFKMNREQILKMYIYCQIIAIPCLFAFLFYCDDAKFAGVNVSYNYGANEGNEKLSYVNLTATCNINCDDCGGVGKYNPICGENGILYLNSCYAGCKEFIPNISNSSESYQNYIDCSCIQNEKIDAGGGIGSDDMKICNVECQKYFFIFVSILFIIIWVSLMSGMPCIACIMRFVEPENKSLSMGIAFIIARLIGSIPGPVIFGYIIDQACVLETGVNGNCLVYNNFSMSVYMMVASLASKVVGLSFIAITLYSSRWSKIKEIF